MHLVSGHGGERSLGAVTAARAEPLVELMNRVERFTLARVWTDLTDDELLWEPIAGMWSVRRREDCTTESPFGAGEWVVDFGRWGDGPEPMTTIAWLLWHAGSMPGRLVETEVFGGPHAVASGWTSPYLEHHEIFRTADRAAEVLRDGWSSLRAALDSATDDDLARPVRHYTYAAEPPRGGVFIAGPPGDERPASTHVVGAIHEVTHHAAQICVLRDLYAHRGA
jgi:hypothetical protein